MLHLLRARLLLSPSTSNSLIKGTEGAKYTPSFGKQPGTAPRACAGCVHGVRVYVCVHEHGPQMGLSHPIPSFQEELPEQMLPSTPGKNINLGVCENPDLSWNHLLLSPPPDSANMSFCSLLTLDITFPKMPEPPVKSLPFPFLPPALSGLCFQVVCEEGS